MPIGMRGIPLPSASESDLLPGLCVQHSQGADRFWGSLREREGQAIDL